LVLELRNPPNSLDASPLTTERHTMNTKEAIGIFNDMLASPVVAKMDKEALRTILANGYAPDGMVLVPDLRSANTARQAEWDIDNRITLTYRGNELAGEVGEACNVIKKLERERLGIKGSRDTVEHLAEELADIIICTDLIAMGEGINLLKSISEKFNATSLKVGLKTTLATVHKEKKDV
jgi:NTP pyrophosphatase (non-canonical NTP hydrolase)